MTWLAFFAGLSFGACVGLLAAGLLQMGTRRKTAHPGAWTKEVGDKLAH